ncbi:MAG: ATP-binding protein [Pseudomonadota bacterium]|nr:ATP-binding protein [Pseudomonadota bacterium]
MDGRQARLRQSLWFQLSAWLSSAVILLALIAGGYSFRSSFGEANELQDDQLRQVAALIAGHGGFLDYSAASPQDKAVDPELKVVVQLLQPIPTAVSASAAASRLDLPSTLPDGLQTVRIHGEDWRLLVRLVPSGQRVAVGQQTEARDEIALNGALRTVLPLLVLVPFLVLVVSGVVRNRLRPVTRLASEVDRRSEDDLTPLPLEGIPTEIRPFAASIGRLLSRLQQAIETQRRFVADAAHELRSPLTAVSLQAQALAASDLPPASKEPLLRLQAGLLRAGALIDQLLTLARSQAREPRLENAVSVSSVVHAVIEDLMPLAESRSIDLGMVRQDTAAVHASQADLYAIVRNLIDNAVRYSPPGSRVDVAVERDGALALLQVVNEGPGIPRSEQERVFDPFHRMLGTDSEGSGLGLAIVRTLVERGGGGIRLQDASDVAGAPGVCVRVWLPAADAGG